jgi:hypothetical protein
MGEIEIDVLRGQCLDRRIGERDRLEAETANARDSETPPELEFNGALQQQRPAKSSLESIQIPPKSHNLCDEVLGRVLN